MNLLCVDEGLTRFFPQLQLPWQGLPMDLRVPLQVLLLWIMRILFQELPKIVCSG